MNNGYIPPLAVDKVEDRLLDTRGLEEAKQIPLDMVEPEEALILSEYINGTLPHTQREELKKILQRYRPAIQKYQPVETIKNVKENIELIEDEKAFLELVDTYDEVETITMYYPIGGVERKMVLDVFPITDSQAILSIQDNLSIFKDLTDKEKEVYNKNQSGTTLTREEEIIITSINKKIEQATKQNELEIVCEFLAMQTKFHGKNSTYEEMLNVYQHMKPAYLALLFQKVQSMQNLDSLDIERVFRESD